MKSAIKEIYNNESGYYELIKPGEEYWKKHAEYCEIYEKILEGSTEQQKKLLDELYMQGAGLESEMGETHFIEGFKLGFRFAVECLK